MRVKCKQRQVRTARFQLVSAGTSVSSPRVVQHITLLEGAKLVADRKAKPIYPVGSSVCVGFQLIGDRATAVDLEKISPELRPFSVTFSKCEVEALAGLRGESVTAAMREGWKKQGFQFDPDKVDLVEAARVKQQVYRSVR